MDPNSGQSPSSASTPTTSKTSKPILLIAVVAIAVVLIVAFLIFYFLNKQKQTQQEQEPIDTPITYVYAGTGGAYLSTPNIMVPLARERNHLMVMPLVRLIRTTTLDEMRSVWRREPVVESTNKNLTILAVPAFPWIWEVQATPYRVTGPALMWSDNGAVTSVKVVKMEGVDIEHSPISKEVEVPASSYSVTFEVFLRQGGSFFVVCAGPKAPTKIETPSKSVVFVMPSTTDPDVATGLPVLAYSSKVNITLQSSSRYTGIWEATSRLMIGEAGGQIGVGDSGQEDQPGDSASEPEPTSPEPESPSSPAEL